MNSRVKDVDDFFEDIKGCVTCVGGGTRENPLQIVVMHANAMARRRK
jgi:hypothetical protein